MRAMAVKEGRAATDINFFPNITPIVGRTLEEAQEKYEIAKEYADWEGGIACVSGFTGLDLSKFPLDEPFDFNKAGTLGDNAVHTMVEAVKRFITPGMTPRQLGKEFAFCGFGAMPVGTPDMIAVSTFSNPVFNSRNLWAIGPYAGARPLRVASRIRIDVDWLHFSIRLSCDFTY
jgi:alkanesulfonate monooxygenase SsuD/methylene tetrahydromethanopterin reductase-like flavin-dependent oxidoreductase (luciferase family)